MKKANIHILTTFLLYAFIISGCIRESDLDSMPPAKFDLKFSALPRSWDEAIPLGNGMLGALVWEKDGKLRFSLDRADLWDLRPMENLDKPEWRFSWVKDQWERDTYSNVQQMFDAPYDRNAAPSKIPGCAVEFNISSFGEIESVDLDLATSLCKIKWKNGIQL